MNKKRLYKVNENTFKLKKYSDEQDDDTVQNARIDKIKMGLLTTFTEEQYIKIACKGDKTKSKLAGYMMGGLIALKGNKFEFTLTDIINRRMVAVNNYLNYKRFVERAKNIDISMLNSRDRANYIEKMKLQDAMLEVYAEIKDFLMHKTNDC